MQISFLNVDIRTLKNKGSRRPLRLPEKLSLALNRFMQIYAKTLGEFLEKIFKSGGRLYFNNMALIFSTVAWPSN